MSSLSIDFEAFCHAQYSRLIGTMTLYTGDPELARDLAQEALARACADWRKVRKMDHPGPWLHRVAINLANSHFRRRKIESRVTEVLAAGSASYTDPAIPTALVLRQRVAGLPPRQRTALILRFFVDLSVHETADLMGCEAHTVKKLTGRAVATLRLDPQLTDWLEDADVT